MKHVYPLRFYYKRESITTAPRTTLTSGFYRSLEGFSRGSPSRFQIMSFIVMKKKTTAVKQETYRPLNAIITAFSRTGKRKRKTLKVLTLKVFLRVSVLEHPKLHRMGGGGGGGVHKEGGSENVKY